jgi:hypothetical protein
MHPKALETSPLLARSVPFLIFVGLTFLQGKFGESSRYWLYLIKTLVGFSFVWMIRPWVEEMRWKFSWEGLMVGFAVFGGWVGQFLSKTWTAWQSLESALGIWDGFDAGLAICRSAHRGFHSGSSSIGRSLLPLAFLPVHREPFVPNCSLPVFPMVTFPGDIGDFRFHAL